MLNWDSGARLPIDRDEAFAKLGSEGGTVDCDMVYLLRLVSTSEDWAECSVISKMYVLPNMNDDLVSDLASLSLTHTIVEVTPSSHHVEVVVAESEDHTTNIDADMIDAILGKTKEGQAGDA